jgi:Carbohydrate family 9 binding domain-like/Carbohydrate esterase, sialic acid-specific acetylesterase/Ig-like domain CHU_C associated/Secretion system C-terminal sorting domain
MKAQTPDPNFHIYLVIGQSNMEGQGSAESADQTGFDAQRFRVFGAVNCNGSGRTYSVGTQVAAGTPIFRCNTKVSLVENFGKVYLAGQPSNVKVGIVPVAIAGCKIELFDKNNYQSYANGAESWMKNIINEYGGNPYARLITVAKEAQKVGVIKGVLFHQGESNTGETAWPTKVKGVYDNIIADLGLKASETPILLGQMLTPGQCSSHNSIIANVPNVITNSHVISSANCGGQSDNLHFTSAGYRLLGQRYAEKMLSLLPPVVTCSTLAPTAKMNYEYEVGDVATQLTATGTSLKWYTVSSGGTATTTAPTPSTATIGTKTYYVSSTGSSCESSRTAIVVTVSNVYKIYKVTAPLTIDGTLEAVWNNGNVMPMNATKLLSGAVSNGNDLNAYGKMLWDNTYLYLLAVVTDDTKKNDSQNSYDDDQVEFYLDVDNAKASAYDANDYQFSFGWNDGTIVGVIPSTASTTGITYTALSTTTGYIVEARIPWTTIKATPSANKLLGIDFMVNDDDDGSGRDAKLSWNAATDDAYKDASLFGTGKLISQELVTGIDVSNKLSFTVFPNPATNFLSVNGMDAFFEYSILDMTGKSILVGQSEEIIQLPVLEKGVYFLQISQNQGREILRFTID